MPAPCRRAVAFVRPRCGVPSNRWPVLHAGLDLPSADRQQLWPGPPRADALTVRRILPPQVNFVREIDRQREVAHAIVRVSRVGVGLVRRKSLIRNTRRRGDRWKLRGSVETNHGAELPRGIGLRPLSRSGWRQNTFVLQRVKVAGHRISPTSFREVSDRLVALVSTIPVP